ncbi:MAG: peptidylprolyl isomerase [Muribaculaceae bacterium]|nr:peptidylprolyl isomerase [Muribaculaceae bacterium]
MKKLISLLLTIFCGVGVAVCQDVQDPARTQNSSASSVSETMSTAKEDAIVEIETTEGPITILLYGDTPVHRDNFIKLAESGYYDGLLFHRVIKDFMVQAGDPASRDADADASLGGGDPGYTLPAEIDYPHHYHKYGALAAARTGDAVNPERRSSGSQFYIVTGTKIPAAQLDVLEKRMSDAPKQAYWRELMKTHAEEIRALQMSGDREGLEALKQKLIAETESKVGNVTLPEELKQDYTTIGGTPHLDNQYTVFGEVLKGMDTVEKIQNNETGRNDRPKNDIKILSTKVIKK